MRGGAVIGVAFVVGVGACDDQSSPVGAGGGGSNATVTASISTTIASAVSAGAGGGDGNDLPAQAISLAVDGQREAALETAEDVDYYRVTIATPGLYVFDVDAQPDDDPFASGYIDAVLTLYDSDEQRRAENDDPWPRTTQDSELITELEAGNYLLRVTDHCHWRELEQGDPCGGSTVFADPSYVVRVRRWPTEELELTGPGEGSIGFAPATTPSGYARPMVWGQFTAGQVESYDLTMPADWMLPTLPGARPQWQVGTFPAGNRGSGASVETGRVWLSDRADPSDPTAAVLGAVDASEAPGVQLLVPATGASGIPGGSFAQADPVFLHVESAEMPTSPGAFFLLRIAGAPSSTWETEPNDAAVGAPPFPGAALSYAVGGELPAGDVDWFALDLAGQGIPLNYFVDARCEARGRGSGLVGLTVELVEQDGTSVAHVGTEGPAGPARAGGGPVLLPAGSSAVFVRVSRQGQSPDNDAIYYQCGLRFLAP